MTRARTTIKVDFGTASLSDFVHRGRVRREQREDGHGRSTARRAGWRTARDRLHADADTATSSATVAGATTLIVIGGQGLPRGGKLNITVQARIFSEAGHDPG